MKFGAEIERSSGRDQFSYTQGRFFYDLGGKPYLMYAYGYDISASSHRQSVYAQDAWSVNGRLTMNAGVRGDFIRGIATNTGDQVFATNSVAPRLGAAWDLLGDSRSVVKAFFGQFYEGPIYNHQYSRAISGIGDFVGYDVTGPTPVEFTRTHYIPYRVDPSIKQPRVDELDLAFERAIGPDLRLSVTGMWRRWDDMIASVLPDARWTPITIGNPLTNQSTTVYRWANRAASSNNLLITNPDGFVYLDPGGNVVGTASTRRDYRSLILVLNKRFTNRYQAQASYVLSHAFGAVDNTGGRTPTRQFESPTAALVNVQGDLTNDRRHEFKLLGTCQIPVVEISLSGYYRILSGLTYTPFLSASNGAINYPFAAGRAVLLESRGSRRMPDENVVDLRIEKLFALRGRDRMSMYVDLSNLFNASVITAVQNRVPSVRIGGLAAPIAFDAPGGLLAPFQARVGARWSF